MGIEKLRQEYGRLELHREQLPDDPMVLFEQWFKDACNQEDLPEPNAMILATISPEGRPAQTSHYVLEGLNWGPGVRNRVR